MYNLEELLDFLRTRGLSKEDLDTVEELINDDFTIGFNVQSVKNCNPFYTTKEAIEVLKDFDNEESIWSEVNEKFFEYIDHRAQPNSYHQAISLMFELTYGKELGPIFKELTYDFKLQLMLFSSNLGYFISHGYRTMDIEYLHLRAVDLFFEESNKILKEHYPSIELLINAIKDYLNDMNFNKFTLLAELSNYLAKTGVEVIAITKYITELNEFLR